MSDVILMYIRQYLNVVLSTIEWIGLEGQSTQETIHFPMGMWAVGFKFPV